MVSAFKAAVAAPILALVWRAADPRIGAVTLLWLPLVCLAGFMTTELRGRLDLQGRHAAAIWLKQGSIAGSFILLAVSVVLGAPLVWAAGASTLARLGLMALALPTGGSAPRPHHLWRGVAALLGDVRWIELAGASVIAAIGGSADRILALRFLPAATLASYFLVCEILSRFWFIPYVLSPIVFARRAGRGAGDGFTLAAWRFTAVTGGIFLAGVALSLVFAPNFERMVVGTSFGLAPLAFAAAVVATSFVQLRIAELQASAASRRVVAIMGLSAAASTVIFLFAIRRWGAEGLLVAWLVKSILELAATMLVVRQPRSLAFAG